jgi:NADH-quinone oxidoreductase subunit D/NADH-quinone oxidoreductase subunit C/D
MSDATLVAEAPAVDHPFAQAVPGAVIGTYAEETEKALVVAPDKLIEFLTYLRDREQYDFLSSVTAVDYSAYKGKLRSGIKDRFEVVYHLYSTHKGGGPVVLHVRVPGNETIPAQTCRSARSMTSMASSLPAM